MAKLKLTNYVLGGYPFLIIETDEIKRAVDSISVEPDEGFELEEPITVLHWNSVEGVKELMTVEVDKATNKQKMVLRHKDGIDLISNLQTFGKKVLVVAELFDPYFGKLECIQRMLNDAYILKNNNICFCVVTTDRDVIPRPLKKLFTVIDFALPTTDEFREFLEDQCEKLGVEYLPEVADACAGLSMEEAENAMTKMILDHGECKLEAIIEIKKSIFESTGFMKLIMPEPEDEVGGLEALKDDLKRRLKAWEPGSVAPKVRALFFTGIPGCGKSSVAKMLGSVFKRPVIIGDLAAMKDKYVGGTGQKTRLFMKTVDAAGDVICIWDEVEKALASGASGQALDGGSSADQYGALLTWMQERKSSAIIAATCNNISVLSVEFLRAGRWCARFFFGFPNRTEKKQIINIMNKRWKANLPVTDEFADKLDHFTGAEIGQLAMDSHFYEDLDQVISFVPKVWDIDRQKIEKILEYANQMRNASIPDPIEAQTIQVGATRSIDLNGLKKQIKKNVLDK